MQYTQQLIPGSRCPPGAAPFTIMEHSTQSGSPGCLKEGVALITGAGRGIGRALALGFARAGASVFATARSGADLSSLEGEIRHEHTRIETVAADLSDPGVPAELVKQAVQRFGKIDVLLNNAGVGSGENPRPVVEFDDQFWNYTLAVNLTAPYLLAKAAIPHMLKQGRGRIINIASLAGKIGLLHGAAYAASKHGLLGLTRTLAVELAASNIAVNAICPGVVRTRSNELRIQYDSRRLGISVEAIERNINPIGRRLSPEEIVPLAVFLASDAGAVITGQAYNVDGGAGMF